MLHLGFENGHSEVPDRGRAGCIVTGGWNALKRLQAKPLPQHDGGRDSTDGDDGSFPVQLVPDDTHCTGSSTGLPSTRNGTGDGPGRASLERTTNRAILHGKGFQWLKSPVSSNGFRLGRMVIE